MTLLRRMRGRETGAGNGMDIGIIQLGHMEYRRALAIQRALQERRIAGRTGDALLVVEHPPVITLGRRGKTENILASGETLAAAGIEVVPVERGGDVTYHGPGQMVGYPIMHLMDGGLGVREFVRNIEGTFIELLAEGYGIKARAGEGVHTGVWVGDGKITAIGLSVNRWVTLHGFAFNVNTNLEHFDLIVPCGLARGAVTSLERLTGRRADFDAVRGRVVETFCRIFGRNPAAVPLAEWLPGWEEPQWKAPEENPAG